MPAYSGNNRNKNDNRRWNSGGPMRGRRSESRPLQDRLSAQRQMISPWESGVAPGTATSLLGDFQSLQNQYVLNTAINRANLSESSYVPNKVRRLGIGNFDDHRGRGLLPSPNTSLMGVAPSNFCSRSSNLQQRLGNNWSSGSSTNKRFESNYYPSDSRRDNSKRPNRPAYRSSYSAKDSRSRGRHSDKKSSKDNTSSKDADSKSQSKDESSETPKEEKDKAEDGKEGGSSNKEEVSKTVKKEDPFPSEVLYCHICDLDRFTSKKIYIRHLEGDIHNMLAEKFHEKNAALLEYLTVSAKFAEMKKKDKLIRTNTARGLPLGNITEKLILKNYQNSAFCCGKRFSNHYDFYEHKLSVPHLKSTYTKGNKDENNETDNVKEGSIEEIDEMITSAKETIDKEPLTVSNIPPYDPSKPIGLHLIEKKILYQCELCRGNPFGTVEVHCNSTKHYNQVVATVKKEEERKMAEATKKQEEEKKANDEKEEPSQKYERRNEEDCESNFSDKNENAADFLTYDDYMKDDDEMIILDEEKNDDILSDDTQPILYEDKNECILNEEPETILDSMTDEPMVNDSTTYDPFADDCTTDEPMADESTADESHGINELLGDSTIEAVGEDFDDQEVLIVEDDDVPEKKASPRRSTRSRR